MEPDATYLSCVALLRSVLISNPTYVRPTTSCKLAPFDQASQKPVFGPGVDCGSPETFLEWALGRLHPSEQDDPPLPADMEAAIQYVWRSGVTVAADRQRRMSLLHRVAAELEPLSRSMCSMMCPNAVSIARAMQLNILRRSQPAARLEDVGDGLHCPHYGLWCAMIDALHWPHRSLVRCMLHGFRTVSDIPDSGLWRPVLRPASMPFEQFAATNAAWSQRCKQRVLALARGEPERAAACWSRTLEERDAGLILGPFTMSQLDAPLSRGFPAFGYRKWRPLPRFAIWQGRKYRCIDDGAAAGTNDDGTSYFETIVCDRPDNPLRIGLRFHQLGPPPNQRQVAVCMGGGAEDAFAAYRRAVTADGEYTSVLVACPAGEMYDGSPLMAVAFRVPGHNFGLASAVLNWHHQSEPPVAFSRRFFGVPVTKFYDDHSINEPSYAGGSGQKVHFELHELLRFHFDLGKHIPWSPKPVYTGVQTDWSCEASGIVSVGCTRDRRDKIRAIIAELLRTRCLTSAEASSLRGKARFCLAPVFGRVGVAVIHLLRERQLDGSRTDIDEHLEEVLRLLDLTVDMLPNYQVRFRRDRIRPTCVVLTDASFAVGHTWLGFLVCCPIRGGLWAGCPTPPWLLAMLARHRERDTYIGQLESAVSAAPYYSLPSEWFEERPVMHYIDNQGALYSMINGRSKDPDTNRLVFVMGMKLATLSCAAWFDYVPSASNFADLPTRLDDAAFARLNRIARRCPLRLPPEWCLDCPPSALRPLFE